MIKRSFSTFNTSLTYNELNCVLTSIAKVINCRPIGLFRQQTANDTELSCVTPFSLMYCSLPQNDHASINILSKNERDDDISLVMSKIKAQTSRVLNRYLDLVLYKFRPIYNKQTGFDATLLSYNTPVLFRYRSTNVPYGPNLFH